MEIARIDASAETLRDALARARQHLADGAEQVEVHLAGGQVDLEEPVTIGPELSGLTLCCDDDQPAVLSGRVCLGEASPLEEEGLPISPEARGKLWSVPLSVGLAPRSFYADGHKQPLATWPDHDDWERWPTCLPGPGEGELEIPEHLQTHHTNLQDITLNVLSTPYSKWINYRGSVVWTRGSRVRLSCPLVPNRYLQPDRTIPFRIENALEAIVRPGQWCFDTDRKSLFWWPPEGIDPRSATLAVAGLPCLLNLEGTGDELVRAVTIRGLGFNLTGQGGAAVQLQETVDCAIERCTFEHLDGQAVAAEGLTRELVIRDCLIHHCGSNGVSIQGPRCTERQTNGHNLLENNHIHHCGQIDWHGAGIRLAGSSHNTIRGNHLHDLPYAGIQLGGTRLIFVLTDTVRRWPIDSVSPGRIREEGHTIESFKRYVCGHNLIEDNRVEDTMMQLDDGGAIYCHASHHNVVRGNTVMRTHRARSHGLYFDDDEVHSVMEDNLVVEAPGVQGGRSSIHVHDNALNTVRRNRVLGAACAFTFPSSYGGHRFVENTVVMKPGAAMPVPPTRNGGRYDEIDWDAGPNEVDHNLYWSDDDGATARTVLEALQREGFDEHSRVARPEQT